MAFKCMMGLLISGGLWFSSVDTSWACHRGGPMGYATRDPGMFSLDVTASTTFSFASTSGTSGCKNWDFDRGSGKDPSKLLGQALSPIVDQWETLSEEAAQGQGATLDVLAQLMGCPSPLRPQFATLLHDHYHHLFTAIHRVPDHERSVQFITRLTRLLQHTPSLSCTLPPQVS